VRLQHAAALALVGWYLLVPPHPTTDPTKKSDPSAPLTAWTQIWVFDSASECQKAAVKIHNDKEPALNAAQCVSTDDPRLKP
jgi:hypothetical protein